MELLAVIAVIGIFVGIFATAFSGGNPTVAVQSSQSQLASLATQARGVAMGRGTTARIIVNMDAGEPERYLRFIGIVYDRNNDPNNRAWVPATDGIFLPQGVMVVPPAGGNGWIGGGASDFTGTGFSLQYISNNNQSFGYIEFNPRGTVTGGSAILAVSQIQRDGPGALEFTFNNPDNVRGLILRRYGSFVLLNEKAAFP